jgi:hypothetical protein
MFTSINSNNPISIAGTVNNNLNPNYVSGFIDAEGCFHISIVKNLTLNLGASVRAVFQISLHRKDEVLLKKFRDFFGVGRVAIRSDGAVVYEVSSLNDLSAGKIILKHPLRRSLSFNYR